MKYLLLLAALCACGRFGFEDDVSMGETSDDGIPDAAASGDGAGAMGSDAGGTGDGGGSGSGVAGCPEAEPMECSPCTGTDACIYGSNECMCDLDGWRCAPVNDPACPATAPMNFSGCSVPTLVCRYGPGAYYQCFDGGWQPLYLGCPIGP